jgi:hypothetical protein
MQWRMPNGVEGNANTHAAHADSIECEKKTSGWTGFQPCPSGEAPTLSLCALLCFFEVFHSILCTSSIRCLKLAEVSLLPPTATTCWHARTRLRFRVGSQGCHRHHHRRLVVKMVLSTHDRVDDSPARATGFLLLPPFQLLYV